MDFVFKPKGLVCRLGEGRETGRFDFLRKIQKPIFKIIKKEKQTHESVRD